MFIVHKSAWFNYRRMRKHCIPSYTFKLLLMPYNPQQILTYLRDTYWQIISHWLLIFLYTHYIIYVPYIRHICGWYRRFSLSKNTSSNSVDDKYKKLNENYSNGTYTTVNWKLRSANHKSIIYACILA